MYKREDIKYKDGVKTCNKKNKVVYLCCFKTKRCKNNLINHRFCNINKLYALDLDKAYSIILNLQSQLQYNLFLC